MDYVLGVLYATKRYEPLETSRVHQSGSPPRHITASLLHPSAFAPTSPVGVPRAAGAGSDSEAEETVATGEDLLISTGGSHHRTQAVPLSPTAKTVAATNDPEAIKATSPLRRGGGPFSAPPLSPRPPRALASGSDRAPVPASVPHFSDSRLRSSSLTIRVMPPSPSAAEHMLSAPREGSLMSPLAPGLHAATMTGDAAHATAGGSSAAAAAAGCPATRPQRFEHTVPTKALSGRYVLLYLPPPHRPGETTTAALWSGAGPGGTTHTTTTSGGGGARAHQTSTLLQNPQMDLSKPRLGTSTPSSSFMAGASPHPVPTVGGRPSFSAPLGKSADPSASTSTATTGGHHLSAHHASHSGAGGGPVAVARQAVMCAAAAAASTQQKLLLFYCLLLHCLAHQKPLPEKTTGASLEGEGDVDWAASGPATIAVLELHYTTKGPVRSNTGGVSVTSALGSSVSVPAGADGHGGTTSISPGATAGGGGGSLTASPPLPSSARAHAYSSSPLPMFPHSGADGACGGSMHPGVSVGGGGHVPTTASTIASPRTVHAASLLLNVGDYVVARGDTCADEGNATAPAALCELLRGGLGTSDVAATQRLSSVLHHLLHGQPNVWLSADSVVFDSEITQNPYYGGWYSVESNDGYRRVMHMCNIQSWPAVVLVDPAGNVVTVEALQYMEEELTRYMNEVDASIAASAADSASRPTSAPASLAADAASASAPETARTSVSAACPSPFTSEASQQASVTPPLPPSAAGSSGLGVAEKSPSLLQPRAPLVAEWPAMSLLPRATTVAGQSSTNPSAAPPAVAAGEGDASTDDSARTPERPSTSLSGSAGCRESSVSIHDPQVPTAEPTPVKAVPTTARYREDSSVCLAPSAATPAATSISAVTVSPLLPKGSTSSNELSAGTQRLLTSPGPVGVRAEQHTERDVLPGERPLDISMKPRAHFDRDESSDKARQEKPGEASEKSINFTTQLSSQSSMPALEPGVAPAASTAASSPTIVCTTKGHASFRSWDPKAYGGDVAGVLAVSDLDSDVETLTQLGKTQRSRMHESKDATLSAPQEDAKARAPAAQAPFGVTLPLTYAVAPGTVAHANTADGFTAAISQTPPSPQSPLPALLPMFSSAFPWSRVLAEPPIVCAPPPLMASVGTVTTVSVATAFAARLDGDKSSATYAGARKEDENMYRGNKVDWSPPLPSLLLASRRGTASTSPSERRHSSSEDAREDMGELDQAAGSPSVGVEGTQHSATLFCTPTATAAVSSHTALRQTGPSNTPTSVSGSAAAAPASESAAFASSHGSLHVRNGATRGVAPAHPELAASPDSMPRRLWERGPPIHPLHRLAFCSLTVSEVRERSRQPASGTTLSSSELEKTYEQALLSLLTQEAKSSCTGDAPDESLVLPSLSLVESIDDASVRRSAASRGLPCRPQSPLPDTAAHRIMARLLEKWQREVAVKFKPCTHVLILFGAGWHPGMAKFVRAVRRLCRAMNESVSASAGAPASRKGSDSDGGDVVGLRGGLGGLNIRCFSRHLSAEDDDADRFASLKGFSNSLFDSAGSGGAGDLASGFGEASSHLDMRSFGSLTRADAEGGNISEEGDGVGSASPSGAAASVADKSASPDVAPRRRVQVIYISADESLQAVCSALAEMPEEWLCVSPYTAQSTLERQLQQHASDMARCIFHVKSFPRMVVVELPNEHQQQQPVSTERKEAMSEGAIGAGDRDEAEDDAADVGGTLMTVYDTAVASQQLLEQQFSGLWTVVQLHGETHLYADPEGKEFPWSRKPTDALRMNQRNLPGLPRVGQQTRSLLAGPLRPQPQGPLRTAGLSPPSPLLESSSPDVFEDTTLPRTQAELLTASDTSNKAAFVEKDGWMVAANTVSLHQPVAHLFPPIKPFLITDGELPSLLERGGYFVVLGAFGSVDSQLHQQCVKALDEVRRWLYVEVEARKQRAWSEPTQLQGMAPHGICPTSSAAGGDRVTLSPAVCHTIAGGGASMDENKVAARYSPGITAAAALSIATSGGDAGSAAVVQHPDHDNSSNRGGSAPALLEESWPEAHGGISPKLTATSPPISGPLSPQLDAPTGLHGFYVGGAPSLVSSANSFKPVATARLLPAVYFYDSILSHPQAPDSPPLATAAHHGGDVRERGKHGTGEEAGPRVKSHSVRHASPGPISTSAKASPRRCSSGTENAAATAVSSPSPAPPPRLCDNTSALRRHHAKDLALLQEYVIAPIVETDGKQLPLREGEVYLACVRWPQRTNAVLRRRLASEAGPTAAAPVAVTSSAAGLPAASAFSSPAGGSAVGGTVSPAPGTNYSLRSLSASQSPGPQQTFPEGTRRRSSTPTVTSPLPGSPTVAPMPGGMTAIASAAATGSSGALSHHPSTSAPAALPPSSSAAVSGGGGSASCTAPGLNSPSLGAAYPHVSAATSLSNTITMEEECKEGSPYPDATPLASVEAIKSFLYDNILRFMEA
ncbi:hypothetical protein LSCM1_04414 [Leishmania martiniquensis]|uniref:Uncharacterized protein n=1 Tax=Leishmania martiniquensis TaxID=1580590 RepID=A0A836GK48_9TRYP|nr:hypothetical protein LSCM1_04414 [Leishmania martiniquensis]